MSDVPHPEHPIQRTPVIDFVRMGYKRSTGQDGMVCVVPSKIAAVADTGGVNQCSILIDGSSDWLLVPLSVSDLLQLIGGIARTKPA